MSSLRYASHYFIRCIKKGRSESGQVHAVYKHHKNTFKLYLFAQKISGAMKDFSVDVYGLLMRENIYWYGTERR